VQYVATLPCEIWKSKNVTDFGSIYNILHVDMFLWTLWGLDLTLTVVRQTVSRLLTLTDWLTFLKLVRRRLESTVERCSAERCCVMVIFSPLLHAHARVRFARVRFHLTSVSFLGFMFYTLNCSCVFFPNKDAFNHLRTVFILCYTSYVVHV